MLVSWLSEFNFFLFKFLILNGNLKIKKCILNELNYLFRVSFSLYIE